MQAEEDLKYMRLALAEAEEAGRRGEIPIGAVIVCEGRVIARAGNATEALHDVTAHAEMQNITAASDYLGAKYLKNCTLYVTVEPCVMCAGALRWAQIGSVVYGASDEKGGFERYGRSLLHPKTIVKSGVLKEECTRLMVDFFKKRR